MGAEVIIFSNPYTYNFLKGLTHSALVKFVMNSNTEICLNDLKFLYPDIR